MTGTHMTVVCAPFSHPDPLVKIERKTKIAKVIAQMLINGVQAVSPALYGLDIIEKSGMKFPDTWDHWEDFCNALVRSAHSVYVLALPGWDLSKGVRGEVETALDNNIDTYLIDPEPDEEGLFTFLKEIIDLTDWDK